MPEKKECLPLFPYGCFALGRTISILHRFSRRFVEAELKDYNITKAQMEILITLHKSESALNQTDINRFFGYNKATVTKLINSLEKEGYIKRIQNKTDKREKLIELTAKGNSVLRIIVEVLLKEEKLFGEILGPDDDVAIREKIYNLAEALKEYECIKDSSND